MSAKPSRQGAGRSASGRRAGSQKRTRAATSDFTDYSTPGAGPAAYTIASTIGGSARFSLSGRHVDLQNKDLCSYPGPAAYSSSQTASPARKAPAFTMSGRFQPAREKQPTPGPGFYTPEASVPSQLRRSAAFTMGGRCKSASAAPNRTYLNALQNPGPADYSTAPASLRTRPKSAAFSLSGRHTDLSTRDRVGYPGPADYGADRLRVSSRSPAFSLRGRTCAPASPGSLGPGPAAYASPKSTLRTTGLTMGSRTVSGIRGTVTPGPAAYSPERSAPSRIARSPAYSMSGRAPDLRSRDLCSYPSPASYASRDAQLSTTKRSAAFTMSGRHNPARDKTATPGPASYTTTDDNLFKSGSRRPPAFTMGGRCKSASAVPNKTYLNSLFNPGPADYTPAASKPSTLGRAASFTLSGRHVDLSDRDLCRNPGPSQYTPELKNVKASSPAYTIRTRCRSAGAARASSVASSPGVGAYTIKRELGGPAFTMSGRTKIPWR